MLNIEICNWNKYQPRNDIKNSSWFRMEHKIYFDCEWSHFTGEEMQCFMYLLATASLKNRSTFSITEEYISQNARISVESVTSAISKLAEKKAIVLHDTHTVRKRNVTSNETTRQRIATDGRTDGRTDDTNVYMCSGGKSFSQVKEEWRKTLGHYKKSENWQRDEPLLMQLCLQYPDEKRLLNALAGFRYEKETRNYDPARYINLNRLKHPDKFSYLENLGELKLDPNDESGRLEKYKKNILEALKDVES